MKSISVVFFSFLGFVFLCWNAYHQLWFYWFTVYTIGFNFFYGSCFLGLEMSADKNN
jgi:hypothetical protein